MTWLDAGTLSSLIPRRTPSRVFSFSLFCLEFFGFFLGGGVVVFVTRSPATNSDVSSE